MEGGRYPRFVVTPFISRCVGGRRMDVKQDIWFRYDEKKRERGKWEQCEWITSSIITHHPSPHHASCVTHNYDYECNQKSQIYQKSTTGNMVEEMLCFFDRCAEGKFSKETMPWPISLAASKCFIITHQIMKLSPTINPEFMLSWKMKGRRKRWNPENIPFHRFQSGMVVYVSKCSTCRKGMYVGACILYFRTSWDQACVGYNADFCVRSLFP